MTECKVKITDLNVRDLLKQEGLLYRNTANVIKRAEGIYTIAYKEGQLYLYDDEVKEVI